MKHVRALATVTILVALLILCLVSGASAAVTVNKGTVVTLVFDQGLNSKTAHAGDVVKLHVKDDVSVGDKIVIKQGTPVTGVLTEVKHRQRYGVNAKILFSLNPVMSTYGKYIPLQHRQVGKSLGGKKTTEAAGATVGGAILLGPIGLVGGYFVSGKKVIIKAGDVLPTEVKTTTRLSRHLPKHK